MPDVATVRVPAPYYDEGLAFCNERLAEKHLPRIDALPAGRAGKPTECPCSVACDTVVIGSRWAWPGELGKERDGGPARFVRYFDTSVKHGEVALPVRDDAMSLPVAS